MQKVFSSKTFWIVSIIAASAIFVLSINTERTYEATTKIMIIPKSVVAAENSDQIIENLRQLPLSLSFYDRMMTENEDVSNDAVVELPDYKRKAFWNDKLRVERVGTSGVLMIVSSDKDRYTAEVLSSQTAKTLLGVTGLYYNIQTDLDVRIIDPMVTDYSVGALDYTLLFERIVAAFLTIFFIFLASLNLFVKEDNPKIAHSNFFSRYDNPFSSQKISADAMTKEDSLPTKEKTSDQLSQVWTLPIEEKTYTDFINTNKTASAPANLPIAPANLPTAEDEMFLESSVETAIPEIPTEAVLPIEEEATLEVPLEIVNEEILDSTREATPEEVKKRLNKLLGGKM